MVYNLGTVYIYKIVSVIHRNLGGILRGYHGDIHGYMAGKSPIYFDDVHGDFPSYIDRHPF